MVKLYDIVKYPISSGSTPKARDEAYYTNSETGIPFVRATDIENNRINETDYIYIKHEVHNTVLKKTKLLKNDILFSIAGTEGRCGIFEHNYQANINQACAIIRIDEKIIKRDYFCLFFNSRIGKLYIEKFARQGVQTNLNLDEVNSLEIPIIPFAKQQELSQQIQDSFKLRKESEKLIELAKQAVETAIEKNEESAMELIRSNVDI